MTTVLIKGIIKLGLGSFLSRAKNEQEFIMSDYERYGDYNEIEDDAPKSKNPVLLILKILTAVICVGVIGLLAFRMIAFKSYPDSVKDVYFNDELTAHYNEKNGDITVLTQSLRAPYDDKDAGNFFCDHLYLIEDINQLQITLRYNESTIEKLSAELGVALDDMDPDLFSFSLSACMGLIDPAGPDKEENFLLERYELVSDKVFDSKLMYRYHKLIFDGVEFNTDSECAPYWIRLEITLKDHDNGKTYMVPIYENNEKLHDFKEYKLGKDERP